MDLDDVDEVNVESLLSLESTRERETKKMGEELLELLSKPTAKERLLMERFRSVGGGQVQEFCASGTKEECVKSSHNRSPCERLHFQKIIQKHTDETLGDCSFLNTCFHMDSCKYVHYKVDYSTVRAKTQPTRKEVLTTQRFKSVLYPPQWLQCDLRFFDMTILGKFAVVMADPPWDIHMELPYGTLSDDEMRKLNIPSLQDEGLIFLWVTGRAMELGRECLKLWGYERCDEIIWVKTNQLQRIIRTGRTGHWLNHGKEHCLVGIKGSPKKINRGLDCDVIVAEVRATSHKPDEIYGIIERLSPGTKKIELFGRPHNVQPNWITLGNQLDGVRLIDPELIEAFKRRYKDGNCMSKNI
jgi:mRNA (2'-O-methyladenosine-N6-)-methyltransferase